MKYLKALNWDHTGDLNEQKRGVNVEMGRELTAEVRDVAGDKIPQFYKQEETYIYSNRWESQ